MTTLSQDVVAGLEARIAELEQKLQSAFVESSHLRAELGGARDRQNASAEILHTIGGSSGDADWSLRAITATTKRLFGASSVTIFVAEGGAWGRIIHDGESSQRIGAEVPVDQLRIGGHSLPGVALAENRQIHLPDINHVDPSIADWPGLRPARAAGTRTLAGTPLRRAGKAVGVLIVHRNRLAPFNEDELSLLQNFADQAAIAIENARLFNQTRDALDRQNAGAEILRTIAGAPGDAARSLQQIAETSGRLFGAPGASIQLAENGKWGESYRFGTSAQHIRSTVPLASITVGGQNLPGQVITRNQQINIPDLDDIDPSMADWPGLPLARAAGTRTMCGTPLRREGTAIGALIVYRDRLLPFTEEELALQQSFADQAVIAIENARLFNETKEALERQTATSDILRVINNSAGDLGPVFESILENAHRLCSAPCGSLQLYERDRVVPVAIRGMTAEFAEFLRAGYPITEGIREGLFANCPIQRIDMAEFLQGRSDEPSLRAAVELGGIGTMVTVPLAKNGATFGRIVAARREVNAFSDKQIALLQGFADQAVIAIENARLFNETKEALARQTATADILKVIASSPSDVQPVFDVIVERAVRLCGARMGRVYRYDDGIIHMVAGHGLSAPGLSTVHQVFPRPAGDDTTAGRAIQSRRPYFVADIESDQSVPPLSRQMIEALGTHSQVTVPMLRRGEPIGAITVGWADPNAYGDQQVALLQTFADQAVIAIENVRLFNETKEALERQTATADILKVIASSPSDVQPVFEAIAISANRLVGGFSSTVFRFIDGVAHLRAFTPTNPAADQILQSTFPRPVADFPPFQMAQAGEVTQIPDTEVLSDEILAISRARGFRSMLFAPLMNDGASIGFIAVTRVQPGSFADHHVQLLRTFADQAVIAIENVRLFEEVQAKTRDLSESLQQQTATADVLKVISRSAFDLQTVLETLVCSAVELSGARRGVIFLRDGDLFRFQAISYAAEASPEWVRFLRENPQRAGRNSAIARSIASGEIVCVPDVLADPEINMPATSLAGIRAVLAVPLLREGKVEGIMALSRPTPGPFNARQIDLVQTFADQAVIAIENVRLFEEVKAKTRDLTEALTYQTGSANILKVIASSPTDVEPVLKAIVESACELCEANDAVLHLRDGENLRYGAHHGTLPVGFQQRPISRNFASGRSVVDGVTIHLRDVLSTEGAEFPEAQQISRDLGTRTILSVPLLRENESIGAIVLRRAEVNPFSDKQIALLQTFADQAVIAIGNVRLFKQVQERTRELSMSLDELRTAQDRLVQTEKLASLGQLTAGIAHEIKNPLNFVNNFAALSAELTDELNESLETAPLGEKIREEVDELTGMLKDNLLKVVQHGKRADSIVKNMLLHSREGSGEHRPADINALLDESLNLAYHGARAEKPQFNVTLQRDFDAMAGMIELFPQEITRVFLNLISNGFYAVIKRKTENDGSGFEPMLSAATRNLGDTVEIRIRDNGIGIPAEVREKMFNPFFTTKPAGEGTGLGLSMSHDIIVKQHGGRIEVETEPGKFTEFRIVLPRTSSVSDKNRGQT